MTLIFDETSVCLIKIKSLIVLNKKLHMENAKVNQNIGFACFQLLT
jgi:hypothetical protein